MIIDWEHSRWYPSFWEYCVAMIHLDHASDWDEMAYDIFSVQYSAELGWLTHQRGVIKLPMTGPLG